MALALSSAMMAGLNPGETAYIDVTITSANHVEDILSLVEGIDYTDAFDQNGDATKFWNNAATSINLYSSLGDKDLGVVARPDLDGTLISFKANAETSFTISFFVEDGSRDFYLLDTKTGSFTKIDNQSSYTFTKTADVELNRFVITNSFTVTTNANGYATYSNSLDLVFVAGQDGEPKAYSATYSGTSEEGVLTLAEEAGVNANTGVIIMGDANTTYTLVPGNVADYTHANVLAPAVARMANPGAYCMTTRNGETGFFEYTGEMIAANKAYLPASVVETAGQAPRRIRMVISATDNATALDNVAAISVEKVLINGEVFILRDSILYNMQGQIVK